MDQLRTDEEKRVQIIIQYCWYFRFYLEFMVCVIFLHEKITSQHWELAVELTTAGI